MSRARRRNLLVAVVLHFRDNRCFQIAGSLAFTTLLGIVPFVTVAFAGISTMPWFDDWQAKMNEFLLASVLPEGFGRTVLRYLDQFTTRAGRLTAIGLGFIALTVVLLMLTIERAFNQLFGVMRGRTFGRRLLVYAAVLTIGPVLMVLSISMTSYLVSQSLGYARGLPWVGDALLRFGPVVVTTAAFALLYYCVPNAAVRPAHALAGGLIAGLLFEVMKRAFGAYVAYMPTYVFIYGAFAAVPVFLLWIYFSWLVVIVGATLTALMSMRVANR